MRLLAILAAAAAATTAPATLAELGRTGEWTVASGDRPRDRARVLEIDVRGCVVVFKTGIDPRGFSAQMIDIGEGGAVERVGRDGIRLRGSTRYPPISVLVWGSKSRRLSAALKDLRKSCQTDGIF